MEPEDATTMIIYIGCLAIAIVIGKFLTNWYHEIEKRNRYMEVQIKLLAEMALASNVSAERINELIVEAKFSSKEEVMIPYEKE